MITNIACVILLILNGLFAFSLGAYTHVATEMAVEARFYLQMPMAALPYIEVGL